MYTLNEASTSQDPSLWERVDSHYRDSQISKTKPSFPKRKSARTDKASPCPFLRTTTVPNPNLPHIDHMPLFMLSYIEKIVDVKGDDNCGFRVVLGHVGMSEKSHSLIHKSPIIS